MDLGLFLLGALGALLTVYLAKQEVIPEFRPLFDTSEKEKEARGHQEHISKTEEEIDGIQSKLKEESLSKDLTQRLTTVLNTSLSELNAERGRLQVLEREIKQSQSISRGLGFLFYIVLGGVFGALLVDKVQIVGLSGDLPGFFGSFVIGATWTSYLSTIGFRSGQKKADERIAAGLKEATEKINTVKQEITDIVSAEMGKVVNVAEPGSADKLARMVAEKLDLAEMEVETDLNLARQMVQRDVKGIL